MFDKFGWKMYLYNDINWLKYFDSCEYFLLFLWLIDIEEFVCFLKMSGLVCYRKVIKCFYWVLKYLGV